MIKVEVRITKQPNKDMKQKIEEFLQKKVGEAYETEYVVDPSIIGGIIIKIGDVLYDGSIKRQISKYKQSF